MALVIPVLASKIKMYRIAQPSIIDPTIFRAYDIRGIVGKTLTPDIIYTLGLALGSQARFQDQQAIVVARDGRLSGPELVKALIQGLVDTGMRVIDIGAVPTPVLYFSTYLFETYSGVMLTGSHNPANYNGLKIVLNQKTLMDESIKALYQMASTGSFSFGHGFVEQKSVVADYVQRIVSSIQLERPLKVVIDAGNGIAGAVAPQLFAELGCTVMPLFCEVDGHFPHHHPDPSELKNLEILAQTVLTEKADLGLAFDGDGDRLGVVTHRGKNIYPDRQLMCFARAILAQYPGAKIVFDVKCTKNLEKLILQHGGIPCWSKTGHSFIKARLLEEKALLGGEMSGHIFFKDEWYGFDDAIYTGARLLDILAKQALPSDDFFAQFPDSIATPELKLPVSETEKFTLVEKLRMIGNFADGVVNVLDGLRVEFEEGWGLVRPSNTSPCLSLRFEAVNIEALSRIQAIFRQQLLAVDPSLLLPF